LPLVLTLPCSLGTDPMREHRKVDLPGENSVRHAEESQSSKSRKTDCCRSIGIHSYYCTMDQRRDRPEPTEPTTDRKEPLGIDKDNPKGDLLECVRN
jgi:hypothetical protein